MAQIGGRRCAESNRRNAFRASVPLLLQCVRTRAPNCSRHCEISDTVRRGLEPSALGVALGNGKNESTREHRRTDRNRSAARSQYDRHGRGTDSQLLFHSGRAVVQRKGYRRSSKQLAARHEWYIGDAGSAEGLADAFIKLPNGILSISELQPWLDVKCWQHNAVPFLTKAFNKGFFKSSFSSRNGHGNIRAADYCYPNILACVQPDVLRKIADKSDLENGFLGRFLFARMVHVLCQPNCFDLQKTIDEMSLLLEAFKRKEGIIHIEKGYSASLGKMFSEKAPEEIDFTWKRLINEYYPRFAFLLSLTDDPATQRCETELKNTDWERAEQLVLWFFANAERLLLNIEDRNVDSRIRARETLLEKVCRKIQRLDRGNGVTIRDISVSGIRNSNAKERRDAISELIDRGIVVPLGDGRYRIDHCPPEWSDN